MWNRVVRWFRSVFGGAVNSLENPEKILQQNIRDMNDQIPAMNQNIAMVKANGNLARNTLIKLQAREKDLRTKIKASLLGSRRDMALNFATTLEQIQADIITAEANLELADKSLEKALKVKAAFMAERDKKMKEAIRAINAARQADWQIKVAQAMESFEIAGVDQTHDEMIQKIEQKSAQAQARVEMALDNVNAEEFELEKEAARLQANETLKQFEIELGLVQAGSAEAQKTLGPGEEVLNKVEKEMEAQNAGASKTMGKEKT